MREVKSSVRPRQGGAHCRCAMSPPSGTIIASYVYIHPRTTCSHAVHKQVVFKQFFLHLTHVNAESACIAHIISLVLHSCFFSLLFYVSTVCADTSFKSAYILSNCLDFDLTACFDLISSHILCLTRFIASVPFHDVLKPYQIFFVQLVFICCNSHDFICYPVVTPYNHTNNCVHSQFIFLGFRARVFFFFLNNTLYSNELLYNNYCLINYYCSILYNFFIEEKFSRISIILNVMLTVFINIIFGS